MTENEFRLQRRQQFLTMRYFDLNTKALNHWINISQEAIPERKKNGDFDPFGEGGIFKDQLNLLKLQYTAGEDVSTLKSQFTRTIDAFGDWHAAEIDYSKQLAAESNEDIRLDISPVIFEDLGHFQLAMDITSLAILFGDQDALRKIEKWMQSCRGSDLLFETLLGPVFKDEQHETEEFFHLAPYDPLLDAIYVAETATEASEKVKEYLEGWYKAFEGVPWHNGHLHPADHQIPYYGYWSFEAAAICLIHDIDDSSFRDHMVYPKDLIEWAKTNDSIGKLSTGTLGVEQLRCEAGQPCPQSGYWFTPAKADSRRAFKQGEIMPAVDSAYGTTIWQWDADQQN